MFLNMDVKVKAFQQEDTDDQDDTDGAQEWLLIIFGCICILAIVVCIAILVVYKLRKNKRKESNEGSVEPAKGRKK